MNSAALHRRRAERYAQLLDEAGGGRRHHLRLQVDGNLVNYVALGTRLSTVADGVSIHPESKARIRADLMATAQREGIGITTDAALANLRPVPVLAIRPSRPRLTARLGRVRARGAILAGLAIGTLTLSGIAAASGDAVPGGTFYGMKLSRERTELALTSSAVARGHLYLGFARTRITEAEAVHTDPRLLDSVLDDMDRQTRMGVKLLLTDAVNRHDAASVQAVEQFVAGQHQQIGILLDEVGPSTLDQVLASSQLLDQVQQQSDAITAALGCPSIVVTGTTDLGPQTATSCQEPHVTPSPATGHHATSGASRVQTLPASSGSSSPSPTPTDDGGLLGQIGHLLGGLLDG